MKFLFYSLLYLILLLSCSSPDAEKSSSTLGAALAWFACSLVAILAVTGAVALAVRRHRLIQASGGGGLQKPALIAACLKRRRHKPLAPSASTGAAFGANANGGQCHADGGLLGAGLAGDSFYQKISIPIE